MTDHSPGSDDADDDYRLAAGTPPDGGTDGGSGDGTEGATGRAADGGDGGPPPQLSGQPGWSYAPTESAFPQVPRQAEQPAEQFAEQAVGLAAGQSAGQAVGQPAWQSGAQAAGQSAGRTGYEPGLFQPPVPAPGGPQVPWPAQPQAPRLSMSPPLPPLPPPPTLGRPFTGSPRPAGPLRGRRLAAIIAGGVALAAVAVTAVVLTSGGGGATGDTGGDGPDVRTLSAAWSLPGTSDDHQVGTWVTAKYLVRATQSGVKAYNLADGTPAWTARPLSGPGVPCAMSPTISASGLGTIGFGPDSQDCSTLVGVDTLSGKTLWSTPLTTKDHTDAVPTTTFLDGQVGVIVDATVVGGVDLTDGHVVWGYKPRGQYCNAYPYGGAGAVVVDDYCADVSPAYTVTAFDAGTGRQIWQKQGTDHVQFGSVVGASPVVATLTDGAVNVYDPSGTPRPLTLPGGIEPGLRAVGGSDSGAQTVNTSTLLLPTRQQTPSRATVTAVNTTTGATSWTYDGDTHQGAALVHPQQEAPSGAGSGGAAKLYAISLAPDYTDTGSPELVTLDPATGHSTVLAKLPPKPSSFLYTTGTVYVLPDGRVLLVAVDGSGTAVRLFQ
ncbi:PQQ-binding-like beta-propeller repeat protein [Streptacidiphilus jiangxiensis]|uniref:PQQ-like domain-containing protein n=1 Tax=Streptacidiphilus jiangxiensis TaxID=235985 RepID=A0A1H7S3E4_STRJI|nr:PQQ-binding-like beta-propeller repeat protein [Streptacidiphilus jiangxiensis]SEL67112.1 PQQ-like domain-containing protein [Streptacidiphilus jiangxiensis]